LLKIAQDEGVLVIEDAPYLYISYAEASERPMPFITLDPTQTVHLFTGSKIGLPGPRVGFAYTEAVIEIADGQKVDLTDLLLTEASADVLFQNPHALRSFEALLREDDGSVRASLWPVAEQKLAVYRENRQILLDGLEDELGDFRDRFHWTKPEAGFFSVFTFAESDIVRTMRSFKSSLNDTALWWCPCTTSIRMMRVRVTVKQDITNYGSLSAFPKGQGRRDDTNWQRQ